MASPGAEAPATAPTTMTATQPSAPVEMNTLQSPTSDQPYPVDQVDPTRSMAQPTESSSAVTEAPYPSVVQPPTDSQSPPTTAPAPSIARKQSEALGPATESPITPSTTPSGPTLSITLMLITGARHPYKIDEKYLRSRNTTATDSKGAFDPLALSGYKLKELIWTDWRTGEWEERPAGPGSIRLIVMGKMVEDKKVLADYNFNLTSTNVVHMTVKPADFGEDDDAAGGKHSGKSGSSIHRQRDAGEGGAGCRCVIL